MASPRKPQQSNKHIEEKIKEKLNEASSTGALGGCATQEYRELPLLEQVRNKRTELSQRYNNQLEVLNRIESDLVENYPEERIANIKETLRNINWLS